MEYLPKGDLYFYIHKQGTVLSETTIRDILAEIIIGIEYLHKHGIVYRELKPENILVTDQGHIKLTDYGLSKLIAEDSLQRGISTFMGAVEYMAPEAISGQYNQKADIWALGMVTY